MRFHVDTWDPDYGGPAEGELPELEAARVSLDVEFPVTRWRPLRVPPPECGAVVIFVDGVQRMDARVWVESDSGPRMGLCASYAAGAVRCGERAEVTGAVVERGLFIIPGPELDGIRTELADYPLRAVAGEGIEALREGLHERMTALEARMAREAEPADLVVVDGHLRGRADIPRVVGYVKRHYVGYLGTHQEVIGQLRPGERTPVFLVTSSWTRYSWYVRLPGGGNEPWAGIARCEASPDLPMAEVRRLADLATAALQTFASQRYQDPRAPQNLLPIAGLERELRRRLGDRELLLRALRRAGE